MHVRFLLQAGQARQLLRHALTTTTSGWRRSRQARADELYSAMAPRAWKPRPAQSGHGPGTSRWTSIVPVPAHSEARGRSILVDGAALPRMKCSCAPDRSFSVAPVHFRMSSCACMRLSSPAVPSARPAPLPARNGRAPLGRVGYAPWRGPDAPIIRGDGTGAHATAPEPEEDPTMQRFYLELPESPRTRDAVRDAATGMGMEWSSDYSALPYCLNADSRARSRAARPPYPALPRTRSTVPRARLRRPRDARAPN